MGDELTSVTIVTTSKAGKEDTYRRTINLPSMIYPQLWHSPIVVVCSTDRHFDAEKSLSRAGSVKGNSGRQTPRRLGTKEQ